MAELNQDALPPREEEDAGVVARNARTGLALFAVYLLLYGGFMGLNVYDPKLMTTTPLFGVNLAIVYGFGLIVAALVLAGIYMWLVRGKAEGGR